MGGAVPFSAASCCCSRILRITSAFSFSSSASCITSLYVRTSRACFGLLRVQVHLLFRRRADFSLRVHLESRRSLPKLDGTPNTAKRSQDSLNTLSAP